MKLGKDKLCDNPDCDDMSSFFPCEIDDAIQYVNFGKIVILSCMFSSFCVVFKF